MGCKSRITGLFLLFFLFFFIVQDVFAGCSDPRGWVLVFPYKGEIYTAIVPENSKERTRTKVSGLSCEIETGGRFDPILLHCEGGRKLIAEEPALISRCFDEPPRAIFWKGESVAQDLKKTVLASVAMIRKFSETERQVKVVVEPEAWVVMVSTGVMVEKHSLTLSKNGFEIDLFERGKIVRAEIQKTGQRSIKILLYMVDGKRVQHEIEDGLLASSRTS